MSSKEDQTTIFSRTTEWLKLTDCPPWDYPQSRMAKFRQFVRTPKRADGIYRLGNERNKTRDKYCSRHTSIVSIFIRGFYFLNSYPITTPFWDFILRRSSHQNIMGKGPKWRHLETSFEFREMNCLHGECVCLFNHWSHGFMQPKTKRIHDLIFNVSLWSFLWFGREEGLSNDTYKNGYKIIENLKY